MNKIKSICLVICMGIVTVFAFLLILKRGRHHHKGVCESAGKDFDDRFKEFRTALDMATQYIQHAIQRAR